jgi:HNH endonuclease
VVKNARTHPAALGQVHDVETTVTLSVSCLALLLRCIFVSLSFNDWYTIMRMRRIINRPISFSKPGCCIYCGAEGELHDEHIIPAAIGGRLRLPEASCRECEQKTHAFEGKVIRGFYGDARAFLGMRRGNRRKWPNKFIVRVDRSSSPKSITVTSGDDLRKFEPVEIDLRDHPGTIVCPIFDVAGIFSGVEFKKRQFKIALAHPDGFVERITKFGGNVLICGPRPNLNDIARFLAKIAHSFAVASFGIGSFIPLLTPGIRGEGDLRELWLYIGGQLPNVELDKTGDVLHFLTPIECKLQSGQTLLLVRISLFAADKLPTYDVVVGLATLATPPPP